MPEIRIPAPLRTFAAGRSIVRVSGATVGEALADLVVMYPALKAQLFELEGRLRPFVNLFVGEDLVRDLQGMETKLDDQARLVLLPSIAGGGICPTDRCPG
jgi:adenylyltransferase/sulfurtransferase